MASTAAAVNNNNNPINFIFRVIESRLPFSLYALAFGNHGVSLSRDICWKGAFSRPWQQQHGLNGGDGWPVAGGWGLAGLVSPTPILPFQGEDRPG